MNAGEPLENASDSTADEQRHGSSPPKDGKPGPGSSPRRDGKPSPGKKQVGPRDPPDGQSQNEGKHDEIEMKKKTEGLGYELSDKKVKKAKRKKKRRHTQESDSAVSRKDVEPIVSPAPLQGVKHQSIPQEQRRNLPGRPGTQTRGLSANIDADLNVTGQPSNRLEPIEHTVIEEDETVKKKKKKSKKNKSDNEDNE